MFLRNENDHFIELVEPAAVENPVSKILSKNGASLYHICYVIENLDQKIEELKSHRFKLVLPPTPAVAFNGRNICFLYHPNLGLIELLEE